jgi:hypothetical protein
MNTRIIFVVVMLTLLVIANYLMMSGFTNYPSGPSRYDLEGFADYFQNAAPTGEAYEPIGAYDGVRKVPEHGLSEWRGKAPNEPLLGPEVEVGPDNLFIFKNNQCKPECCGASFSCGSGCVCTTSKQREFINTRGGNRTSPDDEA